MLNCQKRDSAKLTQWTNAKTLFRQINVGQLVGRINCPPLLLDFAVEPILELRRPGVSDKRPVALNVNQLTRLAGLLVLECLLDFCAAELLVTRGFTVSTNS